MSGRIVLFAKAPRAGRVKTRLAATHGDDFAVALARASLLDTWSTIPSHGEPLLAWDGALDDVPLELDARVVPQGDGDLGARLERVLRDALSSPTTVEWVIALGSDSPGLPRQLLTSAIAALATHDAAIGPAEDGGFYLLALRLVPFDAFAGVPWSTDRTCAATIAALRANGLRVQELPSWFDVDVAADVERLRSAIVAREVEAPNVARVLGITS